MFINLTPHEIVMKVNDVDGLIKVPPSGEVLRLDEDVQEWSTIEKIPVVTKTYRIENLPDEKPGVWYLVSSMVLAYVPVARVDFLAPDTGVGSAIRNEKGQIIAVKRLMAP